MRRYLKFSSTISMIVLLVIFVGCASSHGDEADPEIASIMKGATEYFEAERSGDCEAVWKALAPSSVFKRDYSYENYLEILSKNELKVQEYVIEGVSEIFDNNDRKALPEVEKLATVKVKVKLRSKSGKETEHNNIFMFLKENGKWYKG